MMKFLFVTAFALSFAGCSTSSNNSGGPSGPVAPSRKAEHRPTECPQDIDGQYQNDQHPTDGFTITLSNGNLTISSAKSGDLPVNGEPRVDKADGSSNTAFCAAGIIQFHSLRRDGTTADAKITKTANGLQIDFTEHNQTTTQTFTRIGRISIGVPNAPGVPGHPGLPSAPTPPPADPIVCNSGVQMTYQYSTNGCDTGKHTLCSLPEYCAALMDDVLNHGCAKAERDKAHATLCK